MLLEAQDKTSKLYSFLSQPPYNTHMLQRQYIQPLEGSNESALFGKGVAPSVSEAAFGVLEGNITHGL